MTTSDPPAAPASRRQRLRAETISDIKGAALAQIAAEGAAALSIRGVARAIGMSPAGLYRYYDGRDALLTDLISDAYNDLADQVERAATSDGNSPVYRFRAAVRAYRRWAVAQPNRFLLIFGTPVPGYAAPEGGVTVAANRRIGEAFFRLAAEGWALGVFSSPTASRPSTAQERDLAAEIGLMAADFPAELVPALLGSWAHWHGLVSLEVTNQLDWIYDDVAVFFEGELDRITAGLGASGAHD